MKNNEKWKDIPEEEIQAIKELAQQWKSLDSQVYLEHPYNEFCLVSDRITDEKVTLHNNCRITFRNEISRKESQEDKLLAILEKEAMDESFEQLWCKNLVCVKRQETKHDNHCITCNEKNPIRYKNI